VASGNEWQQNWKHYRIPGNIMVSRRQRLIEAGDDKSNAMLVEDIVLEEMPLKLELEDRGVERIYRSR
jgi:hypothetical protein